MGKKKKNTINAICIKAHTVKDAQKNVVKEFVEGETYKLKQQTFLYLKRLGIVDAA